MAIQNTPFEDKPYPYQPHGSFLTPPEGAGAGQGGDQGGIGASLSPYLGSLFSPNQAASDQPMPAPTPPQGAAQSPYALGPEGQDEGPGSRAFADRIGQGVLAASQAGAAQAMGSQKKKKSFGGMSGQMGGGSDAGGFGGGFTGQV